MERDAQFTQRKAERATLRSHFRDKYRLPKVSLGAWTGRHIRTLNLELPSLCPGSAPQLSAPKTHGVLGWILRSLTQRPGLGAEGKPSLPKTDRFVFLEPVQAPSLPHGPLLQTAIRPRQTKKWKAVDFTSSSTDGAPAHPGRAGWRREADPLCARHLAFIPSCSPSVSLPRSYHPLYK